MSKETFTNAAYEDDREQTISLQTNPLPPPSAKMNTPITGKDVHEELCDPSLEVVDHTSKTFCSAVLSRLFENRNVFVLFIIQLKKVENILKQKLKRDSQNLLAHGFEKRTVCSSTEPPYQLY